MWKAESGVLLMEVDRDLQSAFGFPVSALVSFFATKFFVRCVIKQFA